MTYLLACVAIYLASRLAGASRDSASLVAALWPVFLFCVPLAVIAYPVWYVARVAMATN